MLLKRAIADSFGHGGSESVGAGLGDRWTWDAVNLRVHVCSHIRPTVYSIHDCTSLASGLMCALHFSLPRGATNGPNVSRAHAEISHLIEPGAAECYFECTGKELVRNLRLRHSCRPSNRVFISYARMHARQPAGKKGPRAQLFSYKQRVSFAGNSVERFATLANKS